VANEEEPRNPEEEPGEPEEGLSQDPFVEKVRPDPSEPPIPVRGLQGLLGNSDREGYKRLYLTRELNSYAEFRQDDVVFSEPIAPEQPPFVGLDATRVGIRRDAAIEYTRVRAARPVDEFDLDVRLGGPTTRARRRPIGGGFPTRLCCTNDPGTGCLLTQGEATCFGFTCGGEQTCGGTCVGFTCDVFTCEPFGTCDLRCF